VRESMSLVPGENVLVLQIDPTYRGDDLVISLADPVSLVGTAAMSR